MVWPHASPHLLRVQIMNVPQASRGGVLVPFDGDESRQGYLVSPSLVRQLSGQKKRPTAKQAPQFCPGVYGHSTARQVRRRMSARRHATRCESGTVEAIHGANMTTRAVRERREKQEQVDGDVSCDVLQTGCARSRGERRAALDIPGRSDTPSRGRKAM